MTDKPVQNASTTEGLPISPSLQPVLELSSIPSHTTLADRRVVVISALAVLVGVIGGFVAQLLSWLVWLLTNLSFHQRISFAPATPLNNHLGLFVIIVPVIGGLIVGVIARYGTEAIRGHGIPEAMEQVLLNESRIQPRLMFLKPLSAAIAIGTGGPFGLEGPIIATGGAFGSVLGQVIHTTAQERKTLLAAGAAAGMAATFGSPVSAVLLAIELLLFEFRPRSLIPVALASAAATAVRSIFVRPGPVFAMPNVLPTTGAALGIYIVLGAVVGLGAIAATRAVYAAEDAFARLPLHWMWAPALGAIAVGVIGYLMPRTLGVGYDNISQILSNKLAIGFVVGLCLLKFVSWSIALGSGTSGGTLAPLFTIGGGLGAALGAAANHLLPAAHIDIRTAALVGMAALFAGASRAMLTSIVFAFETTLQVDGLLPTLAGCAAAYLVSCLLMPETIMTEKIARRGVRVPAEYTADPLAAIPVRRAATPRVVWLKADDTLEQARKWLASGAVEANHQGFPVLDGNGQLVGVLTKRDLLNVKDATTCHLRELLKRPPLFVYNDATLRDVTEQMISHGIGRLPVISRRPPHTLVGIITRSDVLSAQAKSRQ